MEFAALPESCVQDVADFFLFLPQQAIGKQSLTLVFVFRYSSLTRIVSDVYEASNLNQLLTFLVTFIGSGKHIKNPYLRARLIEVLSFLSPPPDSNQVQKNIYT